MIKGGISPPLPLPLTHLFPPPVAMEDERSTPYRGNCHCGRYRFELSLPGNIKTAMACTCSLCVVKGYLWIMPPEGSFRVIRDDGRLQEYTSKAMSDKV